MRIEEALPRGFDELRMIWRKMVDVLNGGIQLDNWNARVVSYTTNAVANTEDAVTHSLKRIPQGFFVVNIDKAGVMYDSGTAWTNNQVFLKCSVASAQVTVVIF